MVGKTDCEFIIQPAICSNIYDQLANSIIGGVGRKIAIKYQSSHVTFNIAFGFLPFCCITLIHHTLYIDCKQHQIANPSRIAKINIKIASRRSIGNNKSAHLQNVTGPSSIGVDLFQFISLCKIVLLNCKQ